MWVCCVLQTTDGPSSGAGSSQVPGQGSTSAVSTERCDLLTAGSSEDSVLNEASVVSKVMDLLHSSGVLSQGQAGVEEALAQVRTAASRPKFSFDSYYLVGLLEHLEEVARLSGHKKHKFYAAVLKKVRAFQHDPTVGDLCLQLVGSEEDHLVATAEARWLKTKNNRRGGFSGRSRGRGREDSKSSSIKCYSCSKIGHISRNCPDK